MYSDSVCFADQATQHRVPVVFNNQIAENTFRLRFECPEIAQGATPGQFLMLRLANCDEPLIGRPSAMYETEVDRHGHPTFVDVVYVVGKLTSAGRTAQQAHLKFLDLSPVRREDRHCRSLTRLSS